MILAPFAIASGAAEVALLIMSSSVILPEGILCCCAIAGPEMRRTEQTKTSVAFRICSLLAWTLGRKTPAGSAHLMLNVGNPLSTLTVIRTKRYHRRGLRACL